MKNKVTLVIAVIISLMSLSYAYVQNGNAKKFEQLAIDNQRVAEEMRKKALEQSVIANDQMMFAQRNAQMAGEQNRLLQEELKKQKK